jgi:hypothetical protein
MRGNTIGVLTVATNKYIHYWIDLVRSAEKNIQTSKLVFHVFTDQVSIAKKFECTSNNIEVIIHEIPTYSWPEATLLRYSIFSEFASKIDEPTLMHLDADMLICDDFTVEIPLDLQNGIGLVQHPGFFRPNSIKLLSYYSKNLRFLIGDFRLKFRVGGLGSWEINPLSCAFVPRSKRKIYVCGGTWFGINESFFKMVNELAANVNLDSLNEIMATWHDESHLNWWKSNNDCSVLSPSFCFDPTYSQLKNLPEYIRAVDKRLETK